MNSLSWLIIVIGIFENISGWTTAATITSGTLLVFGIFVFGIWMLNAYASDNPKRFPEFMATFETKVRPLFKKGFTIFGTVFMIAMLMNMIIPRKEYMIMAAASQVGEMVVQSETVQSMNTELGGLSKDAVDLLKTYIQLETTKLKEELLPPTNESNKVFKNDK